MTVRSTGDRSRECRGRPRVEAVGTGEWRTASPAVFRTVRPNRHPGRQIRRQGGHPPVSGHGHYLWQGQRCIAGHPVDRGMPEVVQRPVRAQSRRVCPLQLRAQCPIGQRRPAGFTVRHTGPSGVGPPASAKYRCRCSNVCGDAGTGSAPGFPWTPPRPAAAPSRYVARACRAVHARTALDMNRVRVARSR